MQHDPVNAPGGRAPPRPRTVAILLPATVALAMLAVIAWSARPLLSPAREALAVQAVHAPASAERENQPGTQRANTSTVQAPGWLEAEPFVTACTALADGVVETIHALEGDRVQAGDVVATLVADDARLRLRSAEARLAETQASLAAAEAELTAAEQAWDQPFELVRAAESSRSAVAETEAELAQLPSLIAAARATLTRLEEEASRVRASTKQGATNELERITADQRAAAQGAEVAALEARRAILTAKRRRLEADRHAAQRALELRIEDRRRLDAARAGLAGARAAAERAAAERDEAALELERTTIHAPITGYVQRRLKAPGDKVIRMMDSSHSSHILHLYDPDRLQVRVDVPLADASHIAVGQPCEIVVDVLPNRVFKGEVLRITHEADLQKNTLQAKVRVIDPDPILRPEMLTRVKFLPPSDAGATRQAPPAASVLVPTGAIGGTPDAPHVWAITQRRNGRGTLSPRPVTILDQQDDWLTVTGDLQPGALLAVGLDRPREGERVVVRSKQQQGGTP